KRLLQKCDVDVRPSFHHLPVDALTRLAICRNFNDLAEVEVSVACIRFGRRCIVLLHAVLLFLRTKAPSEGDERPAAEQETTGANIMAHGSSYRVQHGARGSSIRHM